VLIDWSSASPVKPQHLLATPVKMHMCFQAEAKGASHRFHDLRTRYGEILGLMRLNFLSHYSPCHAAKSLLLACGVAQNFLPKISALYAAA
jgi:hypothetical protein